MAAAEALQKGRVKIQFVKIIADSNLCPMQKRSGFVDVFSCCTVYLCVCRVLKALCLALDYHYRALYILCVKISADTDVGDSEPGACLEECVVQTGAECVYWDGCSLTEEGSDISGRVCMET